MRDTDILWLRLDSLNSSILAVTYPDKGKPIDTLMKYKTHDFFDVMWKIYILFPTEYYRTAVLPSVSKTLKDTKGEPKEYYCSNFIKRRLPKWEYISTICEAFKLEARSEVLKSPYGNGAFIVVRVREGLIHGEGRQVV